MIPRIFEPIFMELLMMAAAAAAAAAAATTTMMMIMIFENNPLINTFPNTDLTTWQRCELMRWE
jgi:hypothetical protein